jgi:phage tail protein X
MQVRAKQGDALDLLCWRHLGTTAGVVEQALELNTGLAKQQPVLPHGYLVHLPEPVLTTTKTQHLIQLWD